MEDTGSLREFERVEFKYWALASQVPDILHFIKPFLEPDIYSERAQRNVSVYLDTATLSFFREHEAETPDRFKLRVRRYEGQPNTLFPEVKRKVKNVVVKTRAMVHAEDLEDVLAGRPVPSDAPANLDEFCRLASLTHAAPLTVVSCARQAFQARDPLEGTRLTLDSEISYQPWRGDFFRLDPRDEQPIDGEDAHGRPARCVMIELKFPAIAPMWMAHFVEHFGLRRTSYSKYCAAIRHEAGAAHAYGAFGRVATRWRGVRQAFALAWQEA